MRDDIKIEALCIPKYKRDLIFELSKNPIFIHNEYNYRGKRCLFGGKPNFSKIARELNISITTVKAYLVLSRDKLRKYHNEWSSIPKNRKKIDNHRNKPEIKQMYKETHKIYYDKPENKKKKYEYRCTKESRQRQKIYREKPEARKRIYEYHKEYYKKEDVKNKVKIHNQIPEIKTRNRKKRKEYYNSNKEKIKEYQEDYKSKTENILKQKKYQKEYSERPEVKQRKREYSQRQDVKARRKKIKEEKIKDEIRTLK